MELIGDDNETNGFSFVWTIHNVSYCVQKTEECLKSPFFALPTLDDKSWSLALYPRGNLKNPDSFGFRLQRGSGATIELKVQFVFSIRTVNGSLKKVNDSVVNFLKRPCEFNFFLRLQEIHNGGADAYLDNDTLTVRCRICKVNGRILESEQCYARTVIGVERTIYNWNLEVLDNVKTKKVETKKQTNLAEISSFTMDVFMSKGISDEEKFEVVIKKTNANKLYFSTCALSLLDAEKILYSEQNEHWFECLNPMQVWTISFTPKRNLITLLKQNSSISLSCEFAVSSGAVYSSVEKTGYGRTVACPLVRSTDQVTPVPTMDPDIPGSWKDNLRCFYSEGKLSDVTIQTSKKKFPAHKAMLCAQSAVFSAMFEDDMKENRTGVVEIEDLEDDTVSRMLVFVYTGTVENLDWGTASKLYFAADKYEMTPLKEQCSAVVKDNISTTNVCECLILADMHNDQELKSGAQDFIRKHATDIFNSDKWKELMKEKVHLAAETMHLLFTLNVKV